MQFYMGSQHYCTFWKLSSIIAGMNINMPSYSSPHSVAETRATFMRSVYTWMTGGILITALVSSYLGNNLEAVVAIVQNRVLYYGLIIAQIGAVIFLSAAIQRISVATATGIYLVYSALTGVTLSTVFLIYTHESIASVFLTTACGFAGLSLIGYTTKRDLGPVGAFCGMALFGLIGWAILSWFIPSLMSGNGSFVYSVIGVLIFAGLTAYDTQKIKNMSLGFGAADSGGEMQRKAAIFGALTLYLDFINLFLMLLRLAGDRRR
jgi:uncharacterized protein